MTFDFNHLECSASFHVFSEFAECIGYYIKIQIPMHLHVSGIFPHICYDFDKLDRVVRLARRVGLSKRSCD